MKNEKYNRMVSCHISAMQGFDEVYSENIVECEESSYILNYT